MANNKSAEKRIKINKRNSLRNKYYKTSVKNLMKLFFQNLEIYKESNDSKTEQKLQKILNVTYSFIDKGTKKNVFHKNLAARKKAKLAASIKNI